MWGEITYPFPNIIWLQFVMSVDITCSTSPKSCIGFIAMELYYRKQNLKESLNQPCFTYRFQVYLWWNFLFVSICSAIQDNGRWRRNRYGFRGTNSKGRLQRRRRRIHRRSRRHWPTKRLSFNQYRSVVRLLLGISGRSYRACPVTAHASSHVQGKSRGSTSVVLEHVDLVYCYWHHGRIGVTEYSGVPCCVSIMNCIYKYSSILGVLISFLKCLIIKHISFINASRICCEIEFNVNAIRRHWSRGNLGSGHGLVPIGNKPFLGPILTQTYVVIWLQWVNTLRLEQNGRHLLTSFSNFCNIFSYFYSVFTVCSCRFIGP